MLKICASCNEEFSRNYSKKVLAKQINFFCSRKCNINFSKLFYKCLNCKKTFSKNKSEAKKFCSRNCSGFYTNAVRNIDKTYHCADCNILISKTWVPEKYCIDCLISRKNNRVKYSKMTLNELSIQYPSLTNYHSILRSDSRRVFKNSQKPKECFVCGYDVFVNICHIKDVKDFDKSTIISEVNNIDNLIALCPNHHWEFDHKLLNINGGTLELH